MMRIKQDFVSYTHEKTRSYGRNNKKKFITVHQTGNASRGANAEMHARLQKNGNSRSASWHWQVDDHEAIQSFPHETQCWHCGDGRADGNLNSIGVEICINSDGDYNQSVLNGAKLVYKIMLDEGIPLENVKQHNDWSGKNCPAQIRANKDGIGWNDFLNMVKEEKKESINTHTVKSGDTLWGISRQYDVTVDELKEWNGLDDDLIKPGQELVLKQQPVVKPSSKPEPKPQPKPSTDIAGAKLVKNEKAYFLATSNIKVRDKPSTKATHTGTLPEGASINYKRVFEGNGYRWLEYTGNSGNTLYLPYRRLSGDTKSWGTFHSSRPEPKPVVINAGDKVVLNASARKYATGETIPSGRKNKTYTAQQVSADRILLKEIRSWVHRKDVTKK